MPRPRNPSATFGNFTRKLDEVIGELVDRFGTRATIMVMSDHGFANFGRQFNLNSWLARQWLSWPGGLHVDPARRRRGLVADRRLWLGDQWLVFEFEGTRARRHRGARRASSKQLLAELVSKLEAVTDEDLNGQKVIRNVYRADKVYPGNATALAPDLIVGYRRGYRASWETCEGRLDAATFCWTIPMPGVRITVPTPWKCRAFFFSNRPIARQEAVPWSMSPHRFWPSLACRRRRR